MKLLVTYLCELCQMPIAEEKIRSAAKDDITIPYRDDHMFCTRCRQEYERFAAAGTPIPTFWER